MSRNKLILLVEDNQDDVQLALRAFRRAEVLAEVAVAGDGPEAMDFLLARGTHAGAAARRPDLVLLDIKLPRGSGIEVLRQVRSDERLRRIPIVMLTTSIERSDLEACYDQGANGFVRKPVDFSQFVETARRIALYWLATNEPPP